MDETNNVPTKEHNAKKQDHHKRRHHKNRNHHPKNEQEQNSVYTNENGVKNQSAPTKEQNGHSGQQNGNPHGGNENRQQKQNDKQRNNDRKQSNGGNQKKKKYQSGGNIHTKRGPEDLYGHPTENDVLTMDELRAKIVLKTADGSAPVKKEESAAEVVTQLPTDLLIPMDADPKPAVPSKDCVEVVGVKFRTSGKVYYFDPKKNKLKRGQYAIVETARGPEFGEVTFGNRWVKKTSTVSPLRPVLRAASDADIQRNQENLKKEQEALEVCKKKILEHRLEMKLVDVQYAFDNSKLLFYFTSEGRVDFRELVKDLASVFHTRIELRQIGIRDEAKLLGGLGACGRPLCCSTFLSDFAQVSIKMAKEQGLSLNSSKISGVCGRLMCCLRYESDVYAEEIKKSPSIDSTVNTPDGVGTVIGISPLAGNVKVLLKNADTPPKHYRRDEVTVLGKERTGEKKTESKA